MKIETVKFKTVNVNVRKKITNYRQHVIGITQNKEKSLLFILVPQNSGRGNEWSRSRKKLIWLDSKERIFNKKKKKNSSGTNNDNNDKN